MARLTRTAEGTKSRTISRVKKTKDPNAPKKGLSAYFFWLKENRERISSENEKLKQAEILKLCGKEWSNLKDKSKYETLAKEDKVRYQKEMEEYNNKSQ